MEKTLKVLAIKHGTVIDHLPAGTALRIIKILKLEDYQNVITVGSNFRSLAGQAKDIIKIENLELTSSQVDQVALLAPSATINIIKNYEVVKKFNVNIPAQLTGIIKCPNPKCITNAESVTTKFLTSINNKKFTLKCHYCERIFDQHEISNYLA